MLFLLGKCYNLKTAYYFYFHPFYYFFNIYNFPQVIFRMSYLTKHRALSTLTFGSVMAIYSETHFPVLALDKSSISV